MAQYDNRMDAKRAKMITQNDTFYSAPVVDKTEQSKYAASSHVAPDDSLIDKLGMQLKGVGYIPRRIELIALAGMLNTPVGMGLRSMLITGPPGVGKTFLAESVAEMSGGNFVYDLMHTWTDSDQLFTGVDVAAAVSGDAKNVRQDGVLARAARLSKEASPAKPVVVCLDEIDKAPERAEMLLLDWLQTGRVPIQPGVHLSTKQDSVLVFITSNEARPLCDPMMRRLRRVKMAPLKTDLVIDVVTNKSRVPKGIVKLIVRACNEVSKAEDNNHLSLQEITRAAIEIWKVSETVDDVRIILSGWAARENAGIEEALKSTLASAIWSEVSQQRP